MYQEITQICTRCRQEDTTSFSSCRFCGTKYDLEALKNRIDFSNLLVYSGLGIVVFCAGLYYFKKNETLAIPVLFSAAKHTNSKKAETEPLSSYLANFFGSGHTSNPPKQAAIKTSNKMHKKKR